MLLALIESITYYDDDDDDDDLSSKNSVNHKNLLQSYINQACTINPQHVPTLLLLANSYYYNHNFKELGSILATALKYSDTRYSQLSQIYFHYARIYHTNKRYDLANGLL